MSLAIDVDDVVAVLLADGWHEVADATFEIDAYEYVKKDDTMRLGGGQEALIPAAGAQWREADGTLISCPLTAVLAVRHEVE